MTPGEPDRSAFETMAVPVVELDTSALRSLLAEAHIGDVVDLAERIENDAGFITSATAAVQVVYANPTAIALLGAGTLGEVVGDFGRLRPSGATNDFGREIEAMLEQRPSFRDETAIRRADGVDLPVVYTSWAPSGTLASTRHLVSLTDISEQVGVAQTLGRLRAELAHAGRISMLGELAASVTHEVNQPLTAVVANAQAGLRWLDREEPDIGEVKVALETILRAGHRATDVVARMLAMSKKQELELKPLSVNALIEETLLFLGHELAKHQVRVHLDLTPQSTLVCADRTQLQQVLVNLFMNAAQAMANAHSWRRILTIRSRPRPGKIRIEIEDTGPGIKAADQDRLFESFFTTKADGMGMGLPICRSIVQAHGGELDVSSRPSLGATFRFDLSEPAAQATAAGS
jgi:signal transduction histidine kinase